MLFEQRERIDPRTKRVEESDFMFLDRVASPLFARVRDLLNDWLAAAPEIAPDLLPRLRARDDEQFRSAFWELYLHEALRRMNFRVQVEPQLQSTSRRRDFHVEPGESHEFTIEAVMAHDSRNDDARANRLARVYQSVNRLDNRDFSIALRLVSEGQTEPSGARLRDQIGAWLATLDRTELRPILEAGRSREMPERTFTVRDWIWAVRALPTPDHVAAGIARHSLIGIYPGGGGFSNPDRLRSRLRGKRPSVYGVGEQPFVIALLDNELLSGADTLIDALYGDEAIQFDPANPEAPAVPLRRGNGFWRSGRNTRVSAILYGREVLPWSIARVSPTLWLNPFAQAPLHTELPFARRVTMTGAGDLETGTAAIAPFEFFGLPSDWPGPEPPFPA